MKKINIISKIFIIFVAIFSFNVIALNRSFAAPIDQDGNSISNKKQNGSQENIKPKDVEQRAISNEKQNGSQENSQDGCASTSILDGCWQIEDILNLILTTLTIGAGVMATGSIIVAGVIYATARDNASQVQKAKTMIFNTVIGIIVYAFFWAIMQWLIPGGIGG